MYCKQYSYSVTVGFKLNVFSKGERWPQVKSVGDDHGNSQWAVNKFRPYRFNSGMHTVQYNCCTQHNPDRIGLKRKTRNCKPALMHTERYITALTLVYPGC